jgi:1-acyl-sn-glycerol-3-phosphate acyltransferase
VKLRGIFALVILLLGLLVLDVIQRVVIAPWAWIRPSRRTAVLTEWVQLLARFLTSVPRVVGGASFQVPLKIPCEPGVLILMNHQSVFDLPLAVMAVDHGYPLVVTRQRYQRWIPLISHLIGLYQHPVVNPVARAGTLRGMIKNLRTTARTTDLPLLVFPEGTRTKDGEIAPLKVKGLELILRARPWKVYVLVVDGLWRWAKVKDLVSGMSKIRGRVELAGTLEWSEPKGDAEAFATEVRNLMIERLATMRKEESVG